MNELLGIIEIKENIFQGLLFVTLNYYLYITQKVAYSAIKA